MSSALIFPTVLEKHSAVAGPKISYESTADIFFEYLSASFAHLAQICITGKNDSLVFRHWLLPGKVARNRTNAGPKLVVIQRQAGWIEPGEFTELHHGACHDKTAASILVSRIVACRSCTQKGNPVLVLQHGGVLERQCVAIKTEAGPCSAPRYQSYTDKNAELPKTRRCLPIAGNHVTNASKRTWVWVRQNPRCAEIFRSAWLTGPQLECQRCAPDFREEQCRSFRRSNHSPDARRLLARGQFHRPLLASINPARSI